MNKKLCKNGFSIVEIILALAIFSVLLVGSVSYLGFDLNNLLEQNNLSRANALANEAAVIVKMLAVDDWSNLDKDSSSLNYNQDWSLQSEGSVETVDNFRRWLEFEAVCRDNKGEVANCGKQTNIDLGSKKVVINIAWQSGVDEKKITYVTYVTAP